nr:hypothetical protein BaRGS_034237 [Batillaria attramentaria]
MNTKQDENDVHSVTQDVMNTKQDENDVHNVTQDVLNTKQDGNDVHNVTQDVLDFKQDVLQHTGRTARIIQMKTFVNTALHRRLQPFEVCPETHFRCPGESDYCLPVFVRCNGVYDCAGHEDEARQTSSSKAFIYWSVRLNSMATETTRKSHDLTIARRLITVAVSDFLCWFPVGLLGLMTSAGIPVASEFSVFTAVIVLPLNSALNPFLYSYNVLAEKRRKAREARLLELLQSQVTSEELK